MIPMMAMAGTDGRSREWEDEGGITYQLRKQMKIDECKRENEAMSRISIGIAFAGITGQLRRLCTYLMHASNMITVDCSTVGPCTMDH